MQPDTTRARAPRAQDAASPSLARGTLHSLQPDPLATMPANLTPQYRSAEQRFREAKTPEEKVEALREMLRVIPKHKGTDHLQGDLKRRLAKLTDQSEQARKSGGRRVDPFAVQRHGAGQVVVVGMPNVGKSALVAALTNAQTDVADYPFTTHHPVPGMMGFEDVQIQLVDTPPLIPDGAEPGLFTLVRQADAALVVVDLGSDDVLDHAQVVLDTLEGHKIVLRPDSRECEDTSIAMVRAVFVRTRVDLDTDGERRGLFDEFFADRLPCVDVSATTGQGLSDLPRFMFDFLELVRVYTRAPNKKDERPDPFVLTRGDTVLDLAKAVHQDFVESLKFARIWGQGVYDGQSVSREHVLSDKDLVELHT